MKAKKLQERMFHEMEQKDIYNQVLAACNSAKTTKQTMQYIQESGECWVGGAIWDGTKITRISICTWATAKDDITRSVKTFVAARNKAVRELDNTEPGTTIGQ